MNLRMIWYYLKWQYHEFVWKLMIMFSNMIQDELKNLSFGVISAAYHLFRVSHDPCILLLLYNNTVTCKISNFCRSAMVFHWLTGQYESSLWELLHEYYMRDPWRHVLTLLICVLADGLSGISRMTRAKVGQKICVSSPSLTQWKISGHYTITYSSPVRLDLAVTTVYLRMVLNPCGRMTGINSVEGG